MSAMLVDIDAAIKEGEGPSVNFQTDAPQDDDPGLGDNDGVDHNAAKEQEDDNSKAAEHDSDKGAAEEDTEEVAAAADDEDDEDAAEEAEVEPVRSGVEDVPQTAVLVDSSTMEADVDGQQTVDSPTRVPRPADRKSVV